jgi:hypothetical protein
MSYWTYSVSYPVADHDVGELVCVEEGVEHAHVVGEPIALGGLVGFPVTQQVECEDFVITPQYRDRIVPDMPLSPALCSSTIGGPLPPIEDQSAGLKLRYRCARPCRSRCGVVRLWSVASGRAL